jgi:DNA polymerase-1
METKLLVDGNYLLHKNFHTFKNFKTEQFFTGTTYGIVRDIYKYSNQFNTKNINVTWDSRSFRKDINKNYKSQRKIDETQLNPYTDIDLVRMMLYGLNIPQYKTEGTESDDLLYTISRNKDYNHIIISSDEDLIGCLNENTSVFLIKQDVLITLENFESLYEFTFTEENWNTYKALLGDKSDNIKGIPRIRKDFIKRYLSKKEISTKEQELIIQNEDLIQKNKKIFSLLFVEEIKKLLEHEHLDLKLVNGILEKTRIKSLGKVIQYFSS